MINFKFDIIKYPKEGYLQHTYSPLQILKGGEEGGDQIGDFTIPGGKLNLKLRNINIDCQPSYDGTVNLILNDDVNVPRIINTRFSKKENESFKVINRNQTQQTNLYEYNYLDKQTRLIKNTNYFPIIDLLDVNSSGCLKGGNYTVYLRYIDGDFNESPIMCESGQIAIFHGTEPRGISGTLADEITTKAMRILISNLDLSYNAFKLYYVRNYSDTLGARLTQAVELTEEFSFTESTQEVVITGYELTNEITLDELNIRYQTVNHVKTQAQVQNMLFFGNVHKNVAGESKLQLASYFIKVLLKQGESIGYVNSDYTYSIDSEYYNPENIYYKLGYWPGEYYRLGIVYIMNDDSYSPVFNLRGCVFTKVFDPSGTDNTGASNMFYAGVPIKYTGKETIEQNNYLTKDGRKLNSFGVFKNPNEVEGSMIISRAGIRPYYYEMSIPREVREALHELGVKGYFFVRQRRLPTIFGQGVSFGVDKTSYSPMIPIGDYRYKTEGFLCSREYDGNEENVEGHHLALKDDASYEASLIETTNKTRSSSCLVSLDADTSIFLQSTLNGNDFTFESSRGGVINRSKRHFKFVADDNTQSQIYYANAVYVKEGTPSKFIHDYGFSTQFGSETNIQSVSFFGKPILNMPQDEDDPIKGAYHKNNQNILRGIYTGIIGVTANLEDGKLYNIRIPDYNDFKTEEYFTIRKNDLSDYFAISNRHPILEDDTPLKVFRGDCYTNTVTVRLTRNFVDSSAPIMDTIVDRWTWAKNYAGFMQMDNEPKEDSTSNMTDDPSGVWGLINKADVNAVPIGTWFSYKCLSSNNLGLRAIDRSWTEEEALLGNPRSFYPLSGMNTKSSGKIADSSILNLGYSSTVGALYYFLSKNLPYQKELFDNRIMFSNIQSEDEFSNGYRVFQNLAYKDIDRQYGAIVKLLPWGTDLLCVFEHGIGIVPVNQKALMVTTTGQPIHLHGVGVLQSQISLITGDYGSTWQESIVQTPLGVYGVDTIAKKVWRYSHQKGLETISDMAVQRFLNDNIVLKEHSYEIFGLQDVKTHYNNYKGDVIFTFYNKARNVEWSLCYNERYGKWVTRYSWIPLYSENINNIYFSFDKNKAEVLSQIAYLKTGSDVKLDNLIYNTSSKLVTTVQFNNVELEKMKFATFINGGKTSYIDNDGNEIFIQLTKQDVESFVIIDNENYHENYIYFDADNLKRWWDDQFKRMVTEEYVYWVPIDLSDDTAEETNYALSSEYTLSDIVELGYEENGVEVRTLNINDSDINVWYVKIVDIYETPVYNPPCELPFYVWLNASVSSFYGDHSNNVSPIKRDYLFAYIVNSHNLNTDDKQMYDKMFINGVYVHGRAGVFDEIDYTDDDLDNQILPTKWYDKQEPFEFEFVINDPLGQHKIFENLIIISNNVAPNNIQFEIEGDSYSVFKTIQGFDREKKGAQYLDNTIFTNAEIKWDTILNQYSILMTQECKSIEKFGRRLGNMHYNEDSWYITINPLLLNSNGKMSSTKLRDKYVKVRIRYSGEDLAVITAIKSILNLSYS